ncbi:hypothetical protein C8R46DRAFT_1250178 [Mycena filopes]|nr:hypothetical protein C8R46DRAFT_1250178 [Mycena filopes]
MSTLSSRRPSLALLYSKLQAQSDPYEELEDAARLFPMEEDEVEQRTYTAPPPSVPTSTPPRFDSSDSDSNSDSDSDSESDSDVEPMDLHNDAPYAYYTDSVVICEDVPFMPPRQQTPIIEAFEAPPSPKPVVRLASQPRAKPAPLPRSRQRQRARSPVSDVDSEREGSTGDASDDDEYRPSPSLDSRKRVRSASPVASSSSRRTSASPPASSSSSSTSSEHRHKRPRLPPPSRNIQATSAELQRVETSDDYNGFVCGVCGWVQKNRRIPDFKRHVKTHQRVSDEGAQKGWRCKGVLVDDATDYGLDADAPTYDFLGQERVGGCMKTFSRRDALKRHLDNDNVSCVGRPTAPNED